MRPRGSAGLLLLAVLLEGEASAAERARDAFIARHLCGARTLLARIHERGPPTTSRNRFLVLAVRDQPQHYVQCIFFDADRKMLCEASSGAYRYVARDGLRLDQAAESVAALEALGFAIPGSGGNFAREVVLGTPPDLDAAARLMLAALHDGYRADDTSVLDAVAPMAGDEPACGLRPAAAGGGAVTISATPAPPLNARRGSPAPGH